MLYHWRKYTALFLLTTLSVFIFPKEFFHALYAHTDTQHIEKAGHGDLPSIEDQHLHCAFLQLETPVYLQEEISFSYAIHVISFYHSVNLYRPYHTPSYGLSCLRGPPTPFV
jgi:hypothetical protein